jgi:hypothetical protein
MRCWPELFGARVAPKGATEPVDPWLGKEGEKFFQPRRHDKTKAQLAFRQQLAGLSSAPLKIKRPPPVLPV